MEANALLLFGVEHSSVAVTLRERSGNEKTLHLSPVALSVRSALFATRFRPGCDAWAPNIVLEVESVAIVENLLRQCYVSDFAIIAPRMRDPNDWTEIAVLLRTCDMLQMTPDIVCELLRCVDLGIHRGKISPTVILGGLLDMRGTSIEDSRLFLSVLRGAASAIVNKESAIDAVEPELRADVLWLAVQNPTMRHRANILPAIAEDIASNDLSILAHIRYLARWRESAEGYDFSWATRGDGRERAIAIIRDIESDENSPRLRARDGFAFFLMFSDGNVVDVDIASTRRKRRLEVAGAAEPDHDSISDSDSSS